MKPDPKKNAKKIQTNKLLIKVSRIIHFIMELQRGPSFSFPACKPASLMPQVNPRHDLEVWSCFIRVWVVAGDMSAA